MCCWTAVAAALLLPERPVLALLGGVVCVWCATVPDVDLSLPGVRHRGPTHSLAFAAAFGAAVAAATLGLAEPLRHPSVAPSVAPAWSATLEALPGVLSRHLEVLADERAVAATTGLAGATAVVSHALGDALTPVGVELLWPLSEENVSVGVVRASNPVANYGAFFAGTGALALLLTGSDVVAGLGPDVPLPV